MRSAPLALATALSLRAAFGGAAPDPAGISEDWSTSPEAYFLTAEERREWKDLTSRESRHDFIERYWLKRDPTPGTEKNEFRDAVLARIKIADARFPIQKTSGSRTKRGMVFIVFGSPARVQDTLPSRPEAPRAPAAGTIGSPVGFSEVTESSSVWIYDRERTPRLLEVLDNRPSLEITFVVDPSRHRDEIQTPGLVEEYRGVLARKSIVNPDAIAAAAVETGPEVVPALPRAALSSDVMKLLDSARSEPRGEDGSVFGSAVVWTTGEPAALVWFYLPATDGTLTLRGRVRARGGGEIVTISEPAAASPAFSLSAPRGVVILRRLPLPPGAYDVSFAVEGRGIRTAASSSLEVPDISRGLSVSSLLLSPGPDPTAPGFTDPFAFGKVRVSPRADAVFLRSESLWYFLEVSGVSDPKSVTLETRLRRGTDPVSASERFPAALVEIAAGRYVSGFELPLAGLPAGNYVLYVTVRGNNQVSILRRGDFEVRD